MATTIYAVLFHYPHEGYTLRGVFSSRQLAEDLRDALHSSGKCGWYNWLTIEEFDLDDPTLEI